MKSTLRAVTRLCVGIVWATAVAYLGTHWRAGFDIRGPFLLMSPFFAIGLAAIALSGTFSRSNATKTAQKADLDAVKAVAVEFDFGEVAVWQAEGSDRLEVELVAEGRRVHLPKNFHDLSAEVRRFAVIRAVTKQKKRLLERIVSAAPFYLVQTFAMLIAGLNLWSIIAYHSLWAASFIYIVLYQQSRVHAKQDCLALSVTRDLRAAKAFVLSADLGKHLKIRPEVRIEALDRAAKRLGIA